MKLGFDITRCLSPTCGKRWRCARYLDITRTNRQTSWADLTPDKGCECEHFLEWRPDLAETVKVY